MRKILLEGTVGINSFHITFRICGIIGPKIELLSGYTFQVNVIQNIIFQESNVKNNPKNFMCVCVCVCERKRDSLYQDVQILKKCMKSWKSGDIDIYFTYYNTLTNSLLILIDPYTLLLKYYGKEGRNYRSKFGSNHILILLNEC